VKLVWDESAWADYVWWQAQDRKVLKRINQLIADIQRNGNEGIGKPEPLKHGFQGYWSRRITDEHRLVYKIADGEIRIAACRYIGSGRPQPRRTISIWASASASSSGVRAHLRRLYATEPSSTR
jgi:toxin YoeB